MRKVDQGLYNAVEPGNLSENDFAQFVGFYTAHMVWMLEGGEEVS